MTNREFYTAIINLDSAPANLVDYAKERLEKLDATNKNRKSKPSKAALENAPLFKQIYEDVLGAEPKTASVVAETVGISVQKASSLLRTLVATGSAEVSDIKVAGKGTQKAYTKLTFEDAAD